MPNIFFTSDTHFGHHNIIKYCKRPFANAKEMDEAMVDRFNQVIRPGDLLYHLGDVCWSSCDIKSTFFNKLNTKEVFLCAGNHDPSTLVKSGLFRRAFDLARIKVGTVGVTLCHYPMVTWVDRAYGGVHLYGHVHGNYKHPLRAMDVGVDTNNFYPYAWEDIWLKLRDRPHFLDQAEEYL